MKTSFTRACFALISLSALGGCSTLFNPATDPLTREGGWHPNHANRANLVLQAAYPADLVHGAPAELSGDGELAAAAIDRLRNDKVKDLPEDSKTNGN